MGHVANSALYSKWYYEITIDYIEEVSHMPLHFRVGWGSTVGYGKFTMHKLLIFIIIFK